MQRYWLIIFTCLALSACSGAGGVPGGIQEVRAAVAAELRTLVTGVVREDPILASQPVAPNFTMNGNIAARFGGPGLDGVGIGPFRSFFDQVFQIHANIDFTIEILDVELNGTVATVRALVTFNSLRADRTPPEQFTASGTDYFVFEVTRGAWLIRSWDEAPVVHGEGEGESL